MRIFLVDGDPREDGGVFRERFRGLEEFLGEWGHDVTSICLREKNISPCTGCFACWMKTPGVCIFKDDHVEFLKGLLRADLVLFGSPLIMGYPSALLKTAIDRFVPSALPYIELARGECRHPLRYDKAPLMGLFYEPEEDTDEEDIRIITTAFQRFARNAHTRFLFARELDENLEEVRHALEHI